MENDPNPYSIGDLAKLSGISTLCIRAWESRHGFPVAIRLPSGHRRYSKEDLLRLQLIAQAQERGHRIGKLSKCSLDELRTLIDEKKTKEGEPTPLLNDARFSQLVANIKEGNFELLESELNSHYESMGLISFIEDYLTPLLDVIGQHWQDGEINVAYEHLASLDVSYFLQNHWRKKPTEANAEEWVVAGLAGDHHSIGQHMVACILAEAGKKVVYLGPRTPGGDLLDFVKDRQPKAVCVSVSISTSPQIIEQDLTPLHAYCEEKGIRLEVGGAGAAHTRFCTSTSLKELRESL